MKTWIKNNHTLILEAKKRGDKFIIGYGHFSGVEEGMKITQEQAEQFLENDIKLA